MGPSTYFLLPEGYDTDRFDAIAIDFWNRFMADRGRELSTSVRFVLEPLTSIHLWSNASGSNARSALLNVYLLFSIAIFSLMVGVINYINMATANSVKRTDEIGVRKILGASRTSLQLQFLVESIIFTFSGLIIGTLIASLVVQFTPINGLLGTNTSIIDQLGLYALALICVATLLLGVLAGGYPAFCLSNVKPTSIFGGNGIGLGRPGSARVRLMLVFVQLTVSIGIISCSISMSTQMDYIEDQDLGFDAESIVVVPLRGADVIERLPEIGDALSSDPAFVEAGISRSLPGESSELYFFDAELESGAMQSNVFRLVSVGEGYLDVMGIEQLSGRTLETLGSERAAYSILVNEATVRHLGWTNPLGKTVRRGQASYEVVGVVQDFNFQDLSREIEPLLLFFDEPNFSGPQWDAASRSLEYRYLSISLADNSTGALDSLREVFLQVDPGHPFEFFYLNDHWNSLYTSQSKQLGLMAIFSLLCVFIAGIGLIGISAFLTKLRTKEIGVRKVLGASFFHILSLIFKNIFLVAIAASIVSSVATYFIFVDWQENFSSSYRVPVDGLVFLVSSATCIVLAFSAVLLQFYGVSKRNPIDALRSE
tara:strand:- start:3717 stop:5510 length:1794 start_codon:yes stop_codon:yes gene_type:complete